MKYIKACTPSKYYLQTLIILSLFNIFPSKAQTYLGVGMAITNNKLKALEEDGRFLSGSMKGMALNFLFVYEINPSFNLIIEPGLFQKNYVKKAIINKDIEQRFYNNYLQLSTGFRFSAVKLKKNTIFLEISNYVGYWLSSKEEGSLPNILSVQNYLESAGVNPLILYKQKNSFNSMKDNRFDGGFNFGIGDRFRLINSEAYIKFYFSQSIIDQQKKYMLKQTSKINQSINLQIAYAIKL